MAVFWDDYMVQHPDSHLPGLKRFENCLLLIINGSTPGKMCGSVASRLPFELNNRCKFWRPHVQIPQVK
jgi:hypothetical protein